MNERELMMNVYKFATVAAMLGALALAQGVVAQGAAKIAFVDIVQASSRSQSVQKDVKVAENSQKKRQDDLDEGMREYRRLQADLAARRSALSEDEAKKQQAKIEAMSDDLEIKRLEIEKQWRKITTEVMDPAVNRVLEAVNRVAKKKGLDLVLRREVVLFGAESLDITPLVVQELDGSSAPAPGASALPPATPTTQDPKATKK